MTKEEMINKLKTIKPTAFPTVATFDMGIQFDVITPNGAYTYFGGVLGDWPVWVFERLDNETIGKLQAKINNGEKLIPADFENTDLRPFAIRLGNREDFEFNEIFTNFLNYPKTEEQKNIYVYSDLGEWVPELMFFNSEEEITSYFFDNFPGSNTWDKMDDNSISSFYYELEEHGEGLYISTSDNIDE